MWDERYNSDEYAYGKEANDFLKQHIGDLPNGRILCLAEGEGRNAVFLAQQGFQVVAIDSSRVGLKKARQLAAERAVEIETVHADLEFFDPGHEQWDGIISIFCHLPPDLRQKLHAQIVTALKPGGILLVEAYSPRQLEFKTGGPPDAALTMNIDSLTQELGGLEIIKLIELDREIHEGQYHNGMGAVVQMVARKP